MILANGIEVRNAEFVQSQLALGYMYILSADAEAEAQYLRFDLLVHYI